MKHILLLLAALVPAIRAANILVLLPFPAPSHFYCFYPLIEELKLRGHNMTVISPFTVDDDQINQVSIHGVHKFFPSSWAELRKKSRFMLMLALHEIIDGVVQGSLTHPNLRRLVNDNSTRFDLLIIELYYNEAYLALAEKFDAPVVALVPQAMQPVTGWHLSNPTLFSYIPTQFLPFPDHMSFVQRLLNTVFGVSHLLVHELKYMPRHQETVDREFHFLEEHRRDVRSMIKRISLTLVNTHYSFFHTRPYLPNTVEVGGIHLKKLKPLPKDLQQFMDDGKHGVVFISFGTMVDPAGVSSWSDAIVEVFDKLPLRVVWKWKPSLLKNISNKYYVQEWLPQNDILNHPNCKLFISHGGIHSIIESINAAVPLLGMPMFSEQPFNVAVMEKLGVGIGLRSVQKDELETAVNRILNEPSFQETASHRSQLFKNRITDPVTTAAYWVEHVLEHKAATHLKSAAEELSWYQYLLVDVVLLLAILLTVSGYLVSVALRSLFFSVKRTIAFTRRFFPDLNIEKKVT